MAFDEILNKLPAAELEQELTEFLEPMSDLLPEKRLRPVLHQIVREILAAKMPMVAVISRTICSGAG